MDPEITAPAASDWKAGLSDEFRDDAALADFKDINSLAKAFKDTKSMVGGMLRVPGEDAADEERTVFQQKLIDKNVGLMYKPDTTDSEAMKAHYEMLGLPKDIADYTKIDGISDERFVELAKMAHNAGATDNMFTAMQKDLVRTETEASSTQDNILTEDLKGLKAEWGEAYSDKVSRAVRIAEATKAPESLVAAMKEGKVDSATLKWMDGLAASMGGEGSQFTTDIGGVGTDTRGELESKRDELTRKMLNENHTPAEYERLQGKLLAYSERLAG